MGDLDIIDRIDALVDDQMADGEPQNGFDFGDPTYPRCPHCNRHWHGLRITQQIEDMRYRRAYDEDYSAATDASAVLCEGSEFIGPQRPQDSLGLMPGWQFIGFLDEAYATPRRDVNFSFSIRPDTSVNRLQFSAYQYAWDQMQTIITPRMTLYDGSWNTLWTSDPEPEPCTVDVVVEFGPQNWVHEFRRIPNHSSWSYVVTPNARAVARLWDKFTAPDYPIPVSPGIDFDAIPIKAYAGTGPEPKSLGRRAQR